MNDDEHDEAKAIFGIVTIIGLIVFSIFKELFF
jgi:hypothetical protein